MQEVIKAESLLRLSFFFYSFVRTSKQIKQHLTSPPDLLDSDQPLHLTESWKRYIMLETLYAVNRTKEELPYIGCTIRLEKKER